MESGSLYLELVGGSLSLSWASFANVENPFYRREYKHTMSLPTFQFYYDAKYLGRVYQLQCKPEGHCLNVFKRYQVLADWSLDNPILAHYENTEKVDYSKFFDYPRSVYHYANLTCWDVIQFLENAFDSHGDIEECCYFVDDTAETEEQTPA